MKALVVVRGISSRSEVRSVLFGKKINAIFPTALIEILMIKKNCESICEKTLNFLINKIIIEFKTSIIDVIKIQAIQASILHKRVFYKDSMVQKDPDFF